MQIETVIQHSSGWIWVDVIDPSKPDLEKLAQDYGLSFEQVIDCMDPEHLPKIEQSDKSVFMILRAYDDSCGNQADTIQELTRKIVIFVTDKVLLTIHRTEQNYILKLKNKWKAMALNRLRVTSIVTDFLFQILASFDRPIDQAINQLELLEMGAFGAHDSKPFEIEQAYYVKRKAFVFKRIIRGTLDIVSKLNVQPLVLPPAKIQHLREDADSSFFYTDELLENSNSLINLHLSLASQRTNEVVRYLTVFSVSLLPLNVITGIYGMNFEHMPELKSPWGYYAVLLIMLGVVSGIFYYFKRKGWLK